MADSRRLSDEIKLYHWPKFIRLKFHSQYSINCGNNTQIESEQNLMKVVEACDKVRESILSMLQTPEVLNQNKSFAKNWKLRTNQNCSYCSDLAIGGYCGTNVPFNFSSVFTWIMCADRGNKSVFFKCDTKKFTAHGLTTKLLCCSLPLDSFCAELKTVSHFSAGYWCRPCSKWISKFRCI